MLLLLSNATECIATPTARAASAKFASAVPVLVLCTAAVDAAAACLNNSSGSPKSCHSCSWYGSVSAAAPAALASAGCPLVLLLLLSTALSLPTMLLLTTTLLLLLLLPDAVMLKFPAG
jgi:hypothetical protein